jgi:hypothetical protein
MKLSHLLAVALGITFVALAPASAERQPFVTYGHPTLEAINNAYLSGAIDEDQALVYRLYFVKAPERLPAELRAEGDQVINCATPIIVEVYDRSQTFSAQLKGEVDGLRARPGGLALTITTTHYIVHYTTTGTDACTAAYAQIVSAACELTWTTLHTSMNWDIPPGDGALGGGANLIDCYIHDLGSGILGQAEPENSVPGTPEPYDYTGFFHVDNNISGTGMCQSTTSHENFHVVEFGYYGLSGQRWFDENCAMMAQEYVFDGVNDYIDYLGAWFSNIFKSIKTFNGAFEYGGIVWPMYMTERFEPELVELIYDDVTWHGSVWNAFDTIFPMYGTTLTDAYIELVRWCWYTRLRNDGNHYSEAGTWYAMLAPDWTYHAYPTGEIHPISSKWPEPLGTSLKQFNVESGSTDNMLVIDFNGDVCTAGVDFMAKQGTVYYEYYMELDANGDGHLEIPDFDTLDYGMTMVHMRYGSGCTQAKDYAMWVDTTVGTSDVPEMGSVVRVYPNMPNPLANYTMLSYSLGEAGNVEIKVMDANGRVVRDLFSGRLYAGDYQIAWDGQDNGGNPVANGMYYARLVSGGEQTVREMTVVR